MRSNFANYRCSYFLTRRSYLRLGYSTIFPSNQRDGYADLQDSIPCVTILATSSRYVSIWQGYTTIDSQLYQVIYFNIKTFSTIHTSPNIHAKLLNVRPLTSI